MKIVAVVIVLALSLSACGEKQPDCAVKTGDGLCAGNAVAGNAS